MAAMPVLIPGEARASLLPSRVIDVAAGEEHVIALDASNNVWAWGTSDHGELGIGIGYGSPYPVRVAELSGIVAIDTGTNFSIALDASNRVWTWGDNDYGQLGDGLTDYKNRGKAATVDFPGLPAGVTIDAVSAGNEHALALASDGTVYAWGRNSRGQLGIDDSAVASSSVPKPVLLSDGTPLAGIVQVAAGDGFSAALHADGTVYTWGSKYSGSLGDGTHSVDAGRHYADRIETSLLSGVSKLYTNWDASHIFAVKEQSGVQTVYGWGNDYSGQLGFVASHPYGREGSPTAVANPGEAGTTVDDILVAASFTIMRTSDGKSFGAGGNAAYALGSLANGASFREITFGSDSSGRMPSDIVRLAFGGQACFAVDSAGRLYAWGYNGSYQLGMDGASLPVPAPLPAFAETAFAYSGTVKDAPTGDPIPYVDVTLEADWGVQTVRTDGNGQFTIRYLHPGTFDLKVAGVTGYADFADTVTLAGPAAGGELLLTPEPLDPFFYPQVAASTKFALALDRNREVWSWGAGNSGALGTGSTADSPVPRKIAFPRGVVVEQIAVGYESGYALDTMGRVWAWGGNWEGQLGLGDKTERLTPTLVPFPAKHDGSIPEIQDIAAGHQHFLALDDAGRIWAAGANHYGQLGYAAGSGSTVMSRVMTAADTPIAGADDIAAGKYFSLAAIDGIAYGWGENTNGQLGIGSTVDQNRPTAIAIAGNPYIGKVISDESANHAFAQPSSGYAVYGWGANESGQLGTTGTTVTSPQPIAFPADFSLSGLALGESHTVAAGSVYNGTENWSGVLVAGSRHFGALGDGIASNASIAAFTRLLTYPNANGEVVPMPYPMAVGAGTHNSFAMLGDGSMLAWGRNLSGSLGSGTSSDEGYPRPVIPFGSDPYEAPRHVAFADIDPDAGQLQGTVTWTGVSNPDYASAYVVAYADAYDQPVAEIATVTAATYGSAPFGWPIVADTPIPPGAERIAVYVDATDSGRFAAIDLHDNDGSAADAPTGLAFVDIDADEGQLAGTITWTGVTNLTGVDGYKVALIDASGTIVHALAWEAPAYAPAAPHSVTVDPDTPIPPGAAKLAVYVNEPPAERSIAIPLVDLKPGPMPADAPTGLAFTDTDPDPGQLAGTITWKGVTNLTGVTSYKLAFLSGSGEVIGVPFADIPAAANQAEPHGFTLIADSPLPAGAQSLAVYVNDASSARFAKIPLVDLVVTAPLDPPSSLIFVDTDLRTGLLRGDVKWTGVLNTAGVTNYTVAFVNGAGQPVAEIGSVPAQHAQAASYSLTMPTGQSVPDGAVAIAVYVNGPTSGRMTALGIKDATLADAGPYKQAMRAELDADKDGIELAELTKAIRSGRDVSGDGTFDQIDARFLLSLMQADH